MADINNTEELEETEKKAQTKAKGKKKEAKTPFFKGVKQEFGKIAWPGKEDVVKQSAAVIGVSLVVGVIITLLDTLVQFGVKFLTM